MGDKKVRTKYVSSVFLSILLVTSLIALPSFIITITSQTVSANSSSENFTIVAIPDSQNETQYNLPMFTSQTNWIVQIENGMIQNENAQNIVFVTHLGDIVNTNDSTSQWNNANIAMSILDNKVPYTVLPGNHDMDYGYSPPPGAGASHYEAIFPASRFQNYSYWGGSYDSSTVISSSPNMNNYVLFSAGGMDFILLSIQYNPTPDVRSWADNVLNQYSNRRAIISTHSYLTNTGLTGNGGTQIHDDVVAKENNVFLVLCGHMFYAGNMVMENDNINGRMVYELLSDYQDMTNGNGWLRLMKFVPSENKIYVKTYSPYTHAYLTDATNQFTLSYSMKVADNVSVLISPQTQKAENGVTLHYTVVVNNNRNASENFLLTDNDNSGWSPSISPTSLVVPAFSSGTASLSVTVPQDVPEGTFDNIWVKATENDNASVFDNESALAQRTIVRGFTISIYPSSQTGAYGVTLNYTARVYNIGIVNDNYKLSVTDDNGWGPSVLPTSLSVPAGGIGTATLSVTLGLGTDNITENVTTNASIVYEGKVYDNTTSLVSCTAIGLPISVSLTPSTQTGYHGENLAYTVVVKNLETTADNFILTMVDTQAWQTGWNPPTDIVTPPAYFSSDIDVYQDTYTMSTANNGGKYNMYVGVYSGLNEYTYTQWNISSIPANATIDNAYVYMTGEYGPSNGTSYNPDNIWVEACKVDDDNWNENVINSTNRPVIGALLDNEHWVAYTWAGYYSWVSWKVSSWVENQFENDPTKLVSVAFKTNALGDDGVPNNSGWFQSKDDNGTLWFEEYVPYLLVNYHIPAYTVSLGPGENWTGTAWIINGSSGSDSKTITATSMTDNTITASATAQAVATAASVSVIISPPAINESTPGTYNFTVTVTNLSNSPENFKLAAIDNENWQPTVPSTLGPIASGGSENATLSVTIPSGAAYGAIDTITVTATSQTDNTVSDSASCIAQATFSTLRLVTGWNLVGFPLENENTTPINMFGSNLKTMKYWTAPGGPYRDANYSAPVQDNLGYWVQLKDNENVALTAVLPPTSRTLYLVAGWNLVHFPLTSASTTPINMFGSNLKTMKYWTAPGGPYRDANYSAPVVPGLGYWVQLKNGENVTIPL
jgi:hypothetical protein